MKVQTVLPKLALLTGYVISLSGCSSIASHTGANHGYYLGTQANNAIITSSDSRWPIKTLAILDYPFSAISDTLILPWDYYRNRNQTDLSLRDRVLASEKTHSTDAALTESNIASIQ